LPALRVRGEHLAVDDNREDLFGDLLTDLCDGQRWKLIRAEEWEEFITRLAEVIERLPVRRRQAILMMLVAMSDGNLQPEALASYLEGRNMDDDAEVDTLIHWLHQFRPHE
jgi:hypothetical protein